jgi:hypothetical protein
MLPGQVGVGVVIACGITLVASPALARGDDDAKIAREAGLKLSDLPDGWEAEPPEEDDDEPFGTNECRSVDRAFQSIYDEIDGEPRAFVDPASEFSATDVENAIALFPTPRAAKRVFRVLETDETRECFEAAAIDSAADIDASDGELESLDVSGGDEAIGFTIVLGDGNPTNSFFLDLVVARVGRALAVFSAFNIGSSLPQGPDVLDAVVGRLERAL